MKIDITSLCFGFKIEKENDSGTAAWATSIGQAPKGICYIDTNRDGLDEIIYGMMYKSHSDFENLKVRDVEGLDKKEEPRGDRERMMFSVFEDVYVNNKKVDGIYTLSYEREDSISHKNRLHICYAKYLTYRGHSNKKTLKEMAKVLGCNDDACWFVTDISIKNQKELHFTAIVVNPAKSMIYADSKVRKLAWESLVPETDSTPQKGDILQKIFYGAPGTGKSNAVKKQTGELSDSDEERDLPNVFRTTFHPDTDYASFVGCYKPTMKPTSKEEKTLTGKDEEIVYEFVPQAFTDAYIYAYTHSTEQTYLVIEEINRGNCAQIFGDLFQLLDRKDGKSEYKIKADKDLANYLIEKLGEDSEGIKDGKLCLPANLNILATMNTSDQSLFPMDSAFKRRWEWEYVPINYGTDIKSGTFEITIGEKTYLWVDFIKEANKRIFDLTQSEDKQLGNFFVKHSVDEKEFKSKVMFYLWYEVLRDETENNKYFFYKKTTVDGKDESSKFIFKDLYEDDAMQTLQQFMEYLGVAPIVRP